MTLIVRQATLDDLPTIERLRRDRAAWLADRGTDQWSDTPGGLSMSEFIERIRSWIAAGQTWIAEFDGLPVGTVTVNDESDPDLWSEDELRTAAIVHAMIVDRGYAGRGIGAALLKHAEEVARDLGLAWLRLDAWTSNTDLHDYYRRAGFHLARIADPASPSAALFEKPVL